MHGSALSAPHRSRQHRTAGRADVCTHSVCSGLATGAVAAAAAVCAQECFGWAWQGRRMTWRSAQLPTFFLTSQQEGLGRPSGRSANTDWICRGSSSSCCACVAIQAARGLIGLQPSSRAGTAAVASAQAVRQEQSNSGKPQLQTPAAALPWHHGGGGGSQWVVFSHVEVDRGPDDVLGVISIADVSHRRRRPHGWC